MDVEIWTWRHGLWRYEHEDMDYGDMDMKIWT
jgi:hypothetical protein